MKKRNTDNIKTVLLIIPIVLLTRMADSLPWWSFVIPVLILGTLLTYLKWNISSFLVGFLSGFAIWFGANLYFDIIYAGDILNKIGLMLSVPKVVVMLISGLIGGLLTGLALYTGKCVLADADSQINLETEQLK